jgi:hypothetical protein
MIELALADAFCFVLRTGGYYTLVQLLHTELALSEREENHGGND